jgi:hypothetical protein
MGKTRNTGFSNNAIQYNSGSITFTSGSTTLLNINATGSVKYGVVSSNTHTITGSMYVTGAFYVTTGSVGIGTVSPSQKFEVVGGEIKAGRVDTGSEGGQVSFGRASDNNNTWYIDAYGSSTSPQLRFVDVDNSAVRMVLTGSNVGIGTTTPDRKLTVGGTTSAYMNFNATSYRNYVIGSDDVGFILYDNFNSAYRLVVNSSGYIGIGTTSPSSRVTIVRDSPFNTGDQAIRIRATDGDGYNLWMGSSTNGYATIQSYQDNVGGATLLLNPLNGGKVYIGASSITNAGTVLSVIGTNNSDPLSRFYLNAASTQTRPAIRIDKYDNTSTTAQVFIDFTINQQTSGNGSITANGASQATFTTWSDRRLKENITDLPSQLSNVMSLRPVEFDYKDGSGHQIGFIAQEVQEVYPDIVSENSEGYLTVSGLSKMESRLIKAIQELKAENDALKTRIETLENK